MRHHYYIMMPSQESGQPVIYGAATQQGRALWQWWFFDLGLSEGWDAATKRMLPITRREAERVASLYVDLDELATAGTNAAEAKYTRSFRGKNSYVQETI